MKTEKSLSRQLMLYAFLFTYLLLISFWSVLYWSLRHELRAQNEGLIRDRIQTITLLLKGEGGPSERLRQRVEREWYDRNYERIIVRVRDGAGRVVTVTPHLTPDNAQVLSGLESDDHERIRRVDAGDGIFETAIAKATVGDQSYTIELALERTTEQNLLARFRLFFLYVLVIGGLASLWIGRRLVRVALRPIREVSATAARVNSESLDARICLRTVPREFHEVASTINGMLDRLEESFRRLTRFSEDMAHELRTPVNNLLGTMEVALSHERTPAEYRNILGSGVEECERLKRVLESLLFIARSADPNLQLDKQSLHLEDELGAIASFYEVSAEEKGVRLVLEVDPAVDLRAERTHLQRCVGNLLSNSIRHSEAGTEITLRGIADGAGARIQVIDRGCGMPAAALGRIGERFFRVEASRSKLYGGTGLGLSIAKSIVEMHGGRMDLWSQEGRGTTVDLIFP